MEGERGERNAQYSSTCVRGVCSALSSAEGDCWRRASGECVVARGEKERGEKDVSQGKGSVGDVFAANVLWRVEGERNAQIFINMCAWGVLSALLRGGGSCWRRASCKCAVEGERKRGEGMIWCGFRCERV